MVVGNKNSKIMLTTVVEIKRWTIYNKISVKTERKGTAKVAEIETNTT